MADRKRKEKPEIAIIGAGRLGTALAVALAARNYTIRALVARRVESARKSATLVGAAASSVDGHATPLAAKPLAAKQIGSLPQADLVFISVPDDQIASVAK